jgi:acetoin utilization deacetylase AcuC-like enzyme
MDLAETSAGGRIVSVLEGGYDLQGLKESVAEHVTALMGA